MTPYPMKDWPLVYIIVLNWNGVEHLDTCFSSIQKITYPNFKQVLVDNGSTDGSVNFVNEHFPQVHILQMKRNIGFTKANNAGMRYALSVGADYMYLLNNDIEAHPDCITELVTAAESDRSIAVCASKMLYFHNRDFINGIGICLNTHLIGWDQFNGRLNNVSLDIKKECIAACGGAFFVRAEVLKQVGLFDPKYFIYFEDVDLCVRLWHAGFRIVTVPKAIVYHKFSATMREGSPWKNYLIFKNRVYFMLKFYPYSKLASILPRMLKTEFQHCRSAQEYLIKLKALLAILTRLPSLFFYRLFEGTQFKKLTWDMLWPPSIPPPVKQIHFPQNLDKLKVVPSRVLMGVNDYSLAQGWYGLETDNAFRYRWMAAKAKVCLLAPKKGSHILQLAMSSPFNCYADGTVSVKICCASKTIALFNPKPDWFVYHFPVDLEEGVLDIELSSNQIIKAELTQLHGDFSVRVSEIGILPTDSPLLRNSAPLKTENMTNRIAIGDQEIGLGYGWDSYEPAHNVRWVAEASSAYLVPKDSGSCSKLTIDACSPYHNGAQTLEVEINGKQACVFHLEKKWSAYHITIPGDVPLLEIRLRTDKIIPLSEVAYSKRRLGIMVKQMSVE